MSAEDSPLHHAHAAYEHFVLPAGTPPQRLYHYTDSNGLLGIVGKKLLWASDGRYLNDASELTYAIDLITKVVDERFEEIISESGDVNIHAILRGHVSLVLPRAHASRQWPFIACFCESDDLLSQWRGYRASFALGFDLLSAGLPPKTYLRKVEYDESVQRELVVNAIDRWLEIYLSLPGDPVPPQDVTMAASGFLGAQLREFMLSFKHPAFQEEQEWRLVRLVDVEGEKRRKLQTHFEGVDISLGLPMGDGIPIMHRASPQGLTPYVELSLENGDHQVLITEHDQLPIRDVVLGPTTDPELGLEALRSYLEHNGYPPSFTAVRASTVPLRR